jgi:hypothetical protein
VGRWICQKRGQLPDGKGDCGPKKLIDFCTLYFRVRKDFNDFRKLVKKGIIPEELKRLEECKLDPSDHEAIGVFNFCTRFRLVREGNTPPIALEQIRECCGLYHIEFTAAIVEKVAIVDRVYQDICLTRSSTT